MQPDDDGDAMRRLQAGENRALDELMNRWQVPLRRFLYRHLLNEHDALDLAQETFMRVYCQRLKFRPGAKFSTWLFTIALNLCRDRIRRSKVRPVVSLHEATFEEAGNEPMTSVDSSPGNLLVSSETAEVVKAAVQSLPDPLRTAIILCEYEEMSYAEAAMVANCSVKAIETRLARARQLLRNSLRVCLPT